MPSTQVKIINRESPHVTTDHALVIHVWHLDVLDDLVAAVGKLPEAIDQFVTLPLHFNASQRTRIASAFPEAQLVPVENLGQDIGALFQLMKQVDLSRYDFICKIHTKKGPNMPHEWRRALLSGVLGSKRQVRHIIDRFRADPQVMLAGGRQLYVHGPSYLEPNTECVETAFRDIIGDFDFRNNDWGFVAGTCFWIRSDILQDMASCPLDFQPAAYVTDGTLAHAAERMFGIAVSSRRGKILLQDLRFPDELPVEEQIFPNDLPRKRMRIAQTLTPLAVNMIIKPYRRQLDPSAIAAVATARHRLAIFAFYSSDGILPPQVIPYIKGLQQVTKAIVVVCDNALLPREQEKLKGLATHVITGPHGECDLAFYKRGVEWAREAELLDQIDDLILCNGSCYGPVGTFSQLFAEMEARNLDFWGATDSQEIHYHLQKYFIVLTKNVFTSAAFRKFIEGITKKANVQSKTENYDGGLTKTLAQAGFTVDALVSNVFSGINASDTIYNDLMLFPLYTLARGLPLVNAKALTESAMNADGANRVLAWMKYSAPEIYNAAVSDISVKQFECADAISFSVIMPTYNRAWCISKAISSIMSQTHSNFELIIVDDGSSDNTEKLVRGRFAVEIERGRLRYVRIPENVGVCNARNIGLSFARNPWIAYADSDNAVRPYYLTIVANSIIQNPCSDAVYGQIINVNSGVVIGEKFDRDRIVRGNFIDLGVFVHRRSLVARFGGFDPLLRRLVDWDLIIRYTQERPPSYIEEVMLDYMDEESPDRITVRESFLKAKVQVAAKHSSRPSVSTILVSYNHEDFIVEAIESALEQKGDFIHEIILSDDGSTDGTRRIIDRYAQRYPRQIRNISQIENVGISENYRRCFREASGEFVAVLEGDDYWTDPEKNLRQAEFLRRENGAAMVLSRIEILNMQDNSRRLLKRQEGLSTILSGKDFSEDQHLNLIVNLSSCMFRDCVMKQLPDLLYDPRISEIALAFYLDRLGGIGFIPQVMSTYRVNEKSVWSGADQTSKHRQAIDVRQCALRVARPIYRAAIQEHIVRRQRQLAAELEKIAA